MFSQHRHAEGCMLNNLVNRSHTSVLSSTSLPFLASHVVSEKGELEKLNQSTDDINRWESELEVSLNTKQQHCYPYHYCLSLLA